MTKKNEHSITIRPALIEDRTKLIEWLSDPSAEKAYPMSTPKEIEDAANVWISFADLSSSLTALYDGIPCGNVALCASPYEKTKHQSLISIVVDKEYRGKGVGQKLMEAIEDLARNKFHMKYLHLEVYDGNPAIRLYERCGFVRYGVHPKFIREKFGYKAKILMQKIL